MKKLLQKSLVALALFGVADAAFAVDPNHIATNEQIDTRNNGWPAKEDFRIVAQEVTRLSQQGQNITQEMRTELNNAFEAFFREWKQRSEDVSIYDESMGWIQSNYSEDVVSADEFMDFVTHPVLDLMSEENHRRIFHDVAWGNGRPDILRHCVGSTVFKDHAMEKYQDLIANKLGRLYILAKKGRDGQRGEERAIASLFLAETCFSSTVYVDYVNFNHENINDCSKSLKRGDFTNPAPCFLPSQTLYILDGELLRFNHGVHFDPNAETRMEDLWQNADPGRVLENLDRLRSLGLTIPDSVASRLFTDANMGVVAESLILQYIQKGKTVLSESFLQQLEKFDMGFDRGFVKERARVPGDLRKAIRAYEAQFVLEREMGQHFRKMRYIWKTMNVETMKINDSEALRLFLDEERVDFADSIVRRYIITGETILSDVILQQLEDFEQRAKEAENRHLERFFWGEKASIAGEALGQVFLEDRQNWRVQQEVQIVHQGGPNGVNLGNQNAEGQGQE